ncbi:uncharacterized protein [Salmo salar]|uniref:Uncharacterized protein n=1 Tax=Salmo salar TaxID=8030 RepID=A0A1S3NL36_SALSA|nr:uncharacterized protein LOC106579974 [Salmo salar]|eukprot:XP_014015921.1 PREDICTED: uncharacterized protein LOC106579974 isoform X2 [Salmo salar]
MVKMRFQTVLFTLSICFGAISSSPSMSNPPPPPSDLKKRKTGCLKISNCRCIMKDGSGVINLVAMAESDGFLVPLKPVPSENAPPNAEILLSFSPCQPFSEPEELAGTDCTDVAACLTVRFYRNSRYISHYINYGRHEGNEFHYNSSLQTLSVSYSVLEYTHPLTVVHYRCSPNRSTYFALHFDGDIPLQIWVESPCACPNACALGDVGPGTIFLIILSLSATAYFILGSCALRPFRTGSGVQIAPEESLWCMLCYMFTERRGGRRRRYISLQEETL